MIPHPMAGGIGSADLPQREMCLLKNESLGFKAEYLSDG